MPRRYILNSAVLTAFGKYVYLPLGSTAARQLLQVHDMAPVPEGETVWAGAPQPTVPGWVSTIGYQETATALELLCGLTPGSIPVNRVQIAMEVQDQAIVFRLVLPAGSPRIVPQDKGAIAGHIAAGHWELGLLTRTD